MKTEENLIYEMEYERLVYQINVSTLNMKETILKMKMLFKKLQNNEQDYYKRKLSVIYLQIELLDSKIASLIEEVEDVNSLYIEIMADLLEVHEGNSKLLEKMYNEMTNC